MRFSIVYFIFFWLLSSCQNEEDASKLANQDSTLIADSLPIVDTTFTIKYRIIHLNDSIKKQFQKQYTNEQLRIIGALNRIDVERLGRLDSLVVPDTFFNNELLYTPFPTSINLIDSVDLIILVSYPLQAFAVYENGVLSRWGPASLGKKSTLTPTGLFFTNWKSKRQISTENSSWILYWNFNLINSTGVSLHQYELPGYPASHSCVRLRSDDAKWIYDHAKQWKLNATGNKIEFYGTPVIIFGNYPFGKPKPWHSVSEDSLVTSIQIDSLIWVISQHLPLILERQNEIKLSN